MTAVTGLRVERRDGGWVLAGPASEDVRLVNDYLGYLGDRRYASGTRRGYAFDLLAFLRWLAGQDRRLDQVDTEVLLRFLAFCRGTATAVGPSSAGAGSPDDGRDGLAAATVNRRLAAVGGLFAFRAMRDPGAPNPMPRGPAARRAAPGQRDGLLGHLARPQPRSALRVRQPRRLPRALDAGEANALLESLHSWRDRAIAGLMLFCGLRSAEVLALTVADVDIARGWARVAGKGGRERRVPVDAQVAGWARQVRHRRAHVRGQRGRPRGKREPVGTVEMRSGIDIAPAVVRHPARGAQRGGGRRGGRRPRFGR